MRPEQVDRSSCHTCVCVLFTSSRVLYIYFYRKKLVDGNLERFPEDARLCILARVYCLLPASSFQLAALLLFTMQTAIASSTISRSTTCNRFCVCGQNNRRKKKKKKNPQQPHRRNVISRIVLVLYRVSCCAFWLIYVHQSSKGELHVDVYLGGWHPHCGGKKE